MAAQYFFYLKMSMLYLSPSISTQNRAGFSSFLSCGFTIVTALYWIQGRKNCKSSCFGNAVMSINCHNSYQIEIPKVFQPLIQPGVWAMDFRVVYLLFAAACQHFCGGSDPSSDIKSISKVFPFLLNLTI